MDGRVNGGAVVRLRERARGWNLVGWKVETSRTVMEVEEACGSPTRTGLSNQQVFHSAMCCAMPKHQAAVTGSAQYSNALASDMGKDEEEDPISIGRRGGVCHARVHTKIVTIYTLHVLLFRSRSRTPCGGTAAPANQLVVARFRAARLQEFELLLETKICDEGKDARIAVASFVVAEFQSCAALFADINTSHLFQYLGRFFGFQISQFGQSFDLFVAYLQQFGEQVQAAVVHAAEVDVGGIHEILRTRSTDGQDSQEGQEERAASHLSRENSWRRLQVRLRDGSCRPSSSSVPPTGSHSCEVVVTSGCSTAGVLRTGFRVRTRPNRIVPFKSSLSNRGTTRFDRTKEPGPTPSPSTAPVPRPRNDRTSVPTQPLSYMDRRRGKGSQVPLVQSQAPGGVPRFAEISLLRIYPTFFLARCHSRSYGSCFENSNIHRQVRGKGYT